MQADIDLNSHQLLNLGPPTLPTHALRLQDLGEVVEGVILDTPLGLHGEAGGRTLRAQLQDTINVLDFVRGGDADHSAAISRALTVAYSKAHPVTVLFPSGVYNVSSTINIGYHPYPVILSGYGARLNRSTNYGPTIKVQGSAGGGGFVSGFTLEGFHLVDTNRSMTANLGPHVILDYVAFWNIRDIRIHDGAGGVSLLSCHAGLISGHNEWRFSAASNGGHAGKYGLYIGTTNVSSPFSIYGGDISIGPGLDIYGAAFAGAPIALEDGLFVESVDGLYSSSPVHAIMCDRASHHFKVAGGATLLNVRMNLFGDVGPAHGLLIDGVGEMIQSDITLLSSGYIETEAGVTGCRITASTARVSITADIGGLKSGAVEWYGNATQPTLKLTRAVNLDSDATANEAAIAIDGWVQGVIQLGTISGNNLIVAGLVVGQSVQDVTILGGRIGEMTGSAIQINSGFTGRLIMTGVDVSDCATGLLDNAVGSGVRIIEACPGLNPIYGTVSWDPPNVLPDTIAYQLVPVTGARVGDFVQVSGSIATDGMDLSGYVPANDFVLAVLSNNTGGPLDLSTFTVNAKVDRRF